MHPRVVNRSPREVEGLLDDAGQVVDVHDKVVVLGDCASDLHNGRLLRGGWVGGWVGGWEGVRVWAWALGLVWGRGERGGEFSLTV